MNEKTEISFEEKLEQLEKIVKALENGDIPLEQAIKKFEEATNLAKDCHETIEKATDTVQKILKSDGSFEDFKLEE